MSSEKDSFKKGLCMKMAFIFVLVILSKLRKRSSKNLRGRIFMNKMKKYYLTNTNEET